MPAYGAFQFEDVDLELPLPNHHSSPPSMGSIHTPVSGARGENIPENHGFHHGGMEPRQTNVGRLAGRFDGDPGFMREIQFDEPMNRPPGRVSELFADQTFEAHQQPGLQAQDGGVWWSPVKLLVGLMPVKTLVGREMDPLTETGVAHILTVLILLTLLFVLLALFLRSYWGNRRGYRGQIRQLSNAYYSGNTNGGEEQDQGKSRKHDENSSGWLSRFWSRGSKNTEERVVNDKKKKKC